MEKPNEEVKIENIQLNLNILSQIVTYQSQNGIRTKDYQRYIKFLGKKINKLRQGFKITQGKKKFNKIEITAENSTDQKLLLVLVLECERHWANASLYNQRLTSLDSVVSDWRYKAREKYLRASKYAFNLLNITKQRCNDATIQEAEAYYNTLNANYTMYTRKFEAALDGYKKAKDIYLRLASKKDAIESILYKDRVKYLLMQIRYCDYNLTSGSAKEDHMFNMDEEETYEEESDDKLNQKSANTNENYDVVYQSSTIPIKNPNLRAKLVKIDELTEKIKNESDLVKRQNIFSDVFNILDDCIKIIKSDRQEKAKDGESFTQIYNKLISYMSLTKINLQLWKNQIYIEEYKGQFASEILIVDLLEKENTKLNVKPQEMIKLYDNLLQYYSQVRSNEKENPEENFFNVITLKEMIGLGLKSFYTSLFYLSNRKYDDTLSLLAYLQDKASDAQRYYELNKIKNMKIKDLESLMDDLEKAKKFSLFIFQKVFIKLKFEKLSVGKQVVDKHEKLAFKCQGWLHTDIKGDKESITRENYEIFRENLKMTFDEFKDSVKKQNYNNYTHLIQFPPNFQVLTPKPISFDLVHPMIQYPDLSAKCKKEEKKGLLGRAFGYMFGK